MVYISKSVDNEKKLEDVAKHAGKSRQQYTMDVIFICNSGKLCGQEEETIISL